VRGVTWIIVVVALTVAVGLGGYALGRRSVDRTSIGSTAYWRGHSDAYRQAVKRAQRQSACSGPRWMCGP
jgi:hypothetical protein